MIYIAQEKGERIGKLSEVITMQAATSEKDAAGGESIIWTDLKTIWANVDYSQTGSDEKEESKRLTAFTMVTFTIRYDAELWDKKNRINYKSNLYDLKSITELGRQQYLVITTELKE